VKTASYRRRIQYYETDAMAVVHHSNHLRLFEEARVAWFRERGLDKITWTEEELHFPLMESSVKYLKPMFFDDEIEIRLQARLDRRRFIFKYGIYILEESRDRRAQLYGRARGELPLLGATGETVHVMVNGSFSIVKNINPKITKIMEAEPWTETWP
jgi:acyl-CoA thioester hydrolase